MKFLFNFMLLLVLTFQNQSFANSKGQKLFEEMEKDYSDMKIRSWLPTSMAGRGSKGSAFYQWVISSKNKKDIEQGMKSLDTMSASCFEVVILFSLRAKIVSFDNVKKLFDLNEKHRIPPKWIKGWLYSLSGGKNKKLRTHYVRAKRPSYKEMDWGVSHPTFEKGKRIFPKPGDIIFFNPIGKRRNSHFDHVALATGRKIKRSDLCKEFERQKKNCSVNSVSCEELEKNIKFCKEYKKVKPSSEPYEAEILSFYGRGSRKDAPIDRTTIEHMLDSHSLIKRTAIEGGDRQVFFSTAPWAK